MSTSFTFDGLDELKAALRSLPADLAAEAGHIIEGDTNYAESRIKAIYGEHVVGGTLRDRLYSKVQHDGVSAVGTVISPDPLAWIFENGTEARHYVTVNGKTHVTGRMPALHAFVPTMMEVRKQMYGELKDLLERHGLEVSGG